MFMNGVCDSHVNVWSFKRKKGEREKQFPLFRDEKSCEWCEEKFENMFVAFLCETQFEGNPSWGNLKQHLLIFL